MAEIEIGSAKAVPHKFRNRFLREGGSSVSVNSSSSSSSSAEKKVSPTTSLAALRVTVDEIEGLEATNAQIALEQLNTIKANQEDLDSIKEVEVQQKKTSTATRIAYDDEQITLQWTASSTEITVRYGTSLGKAIKVTSNTMIYVKCTYSTQVPPTVTDGNGDSIELTYDDTKAMYYFLAGSMAGSSGVLTATITHAHSGSGTLSVYVLNAIINVSEAINTAVEANAKMLFGLVDALCTATGKTITYNATTGVWTVS